MWNAVARAGFLADASGSPGGRLMVAGASFSRKGHDQSTSSMCRFTETAALRQFNRIVYSSNDERARSRYRA